jgi:hypothetical protein
MGHVPYVGWATCSRATAMTKSCHSHHPKLRRLTKYWQSRTHTQNKEYQTRTHTLPLNQTNTKLNKLYVGYKNHISVSFFSFMDDYLVGWLNIQLSLKTMNLIEIQPNIINRNPTHNSNTNFIYKSIEKKKMNETHLLSGFSSTVALWKSEALWSRLGRDPFNRQIPSTYSMLSRSALSRSTPSFCSLSLSSLALSSLSLTPLSPSQAHPISFGNAFLLESMKSVRERKWDTNCSKYFFFHYFIS